MVKVNTTLQFPMTVADSWNNGAIIDINKAKYMPSDGLANAPATPPFPINLNPVESGDCLYLNVWVPSIAAPSEGFAVLF
jgi:carboxylesterase type B